MSKIYTLEFSSIQNTQGTVYLTDSTRDKPVKVSINIDDTDFQYRSSKAECPSKVADLIDLAVAIHGSDRLVRQPFNQSPCQIKVILPVRNPDLLNSKLFQEKLENLMHWSTGSNWCFSFTKRDDIKRSMEENNLFDLAGEINEVALWSGGLDALAGLYNRICDNPEGSFILCGSGSNTRIFEIQKQTFEAIELLFPNRLKLYRIPISLSNSQNCKKNSISRSRGIVFMLIGSACAYLMDKRVLNVYENGIGAINLPYRDSALGLDHTRSVHPRTLVMVSELISILLEESFKIENPFLFWTKAQMCQMLVKNNVTDLAFLTNSCDKYLHQNPSQCGYCSSCLIRKQSLIAEGIEDKTKYYISHGGASVKQNPYLYLNNILEQIKTFNDLLTASDNIEQQWNAIANKYPQLNYEVLDYLDSSYSNLSRNNIRDLLVNLYQNYIDEWNRVRSKIQTTLVPHASQALVSKSLTIDNSDFPLLSTIEDYNHDE